MTTTETPTLGHFVRNIINNTDEVDPRKIAAQVVAETPRPDLMAYYHEALVSFVRTTLALERQQAIRATRTDDYTSPDHTGLTLLEHGNIKPTAIRKPNRSAKREAAAAHWERALNTSLYVAEGIRKKFRHCTSTDLGFVIDGYAKRVEQNAHWANYYSAVQTLMDQHNVETVEQLPTSILATIGEPK